MNKSRRRWPQVTVDFVTAHTQLECQRRLVLGSRIIGMWLFNRDEAQGVLTVSGAIE